MIVVMAITNTEYRRQAWDYLIAMGCTEAGAAGMLGNIYAESGVVPNKVEKLCLNRLKEHGKTYTDATYTAAVDSGKISREEFLHPLPGKQYGYGLTQTTTYTRKSKLYDMAKKIGKSIGSMRVQLAFLKYELSNGYKSTLEVLTTAKTVKEASDYVLMHFEIPANAAAMKSTRQKYSEEFFRMYSNNKEEHTMLSNCSIDERGKASGGKAGDQTGREWRIRSWYDKGWTAVFRHPNAEVREMIAKLATEAANAPVGYDQSNRTSFWRELQKVGYRPSKITKKCEADCSAGVAAIVKATGHLLGIRKLMNVSADMYTGNEAAVLKAAGFKMLTGKKYLNSDKYLRRGDILLARSAHAHHTCTNLTNGSLSGATKKIHGGASTAIKGLSRAELLDGTVAIAKQNVWKGADPKMDKCSFSPLKRGDKIKVCDALTGSDGLLWYYIKNSDGKYGFLRSGNAAGKEYVTIREKGKVTASALYVRAGAGKRYRAKGTVKKGDVVTVVGYNRGWFKIKGDISGWCSSKYIKLSK